MDLVKEKQLRRMRLLHKKYFGKKFKNKKNNNANANSNEGANTKTKEQHNSQHEINEVEQEDTQVLKGQVHCPKKRPLTVTIFAVSHPQTTSSIHNHINLNDIPANPSTIIKLRNLLSSEMKSDH